MCTVTYIPGSTENSFILTSNRDEKMFRKTKAPEVYHFKDVDVCFPKDMEKGGSWIAANNKGRICCLLNGAFIPHKKQSFHVQSRGQVLIEMASTEKNSSDYFKQKDLSDVEPFTIINIEHNQAEAMHLTEYIWDGEQKYKTKRDVQTPRIWSSVTLYSPSDRELRTGWFKKFLLETKHERSPERVYDFHSGEHTSDRSVNLLMQREEGLKTLSITQLIHTNNKINMKYTDLLHSTIHRIEL